MFILNVHFISFFILPNVLYMPLKSN